MQAVRVYGRMQDAITNYWLPLGDVLRTMIHGVGVVLRTRYLGVVLFTMMMYGRRVDDGHPHGRAGGGGARVPLVVDDCCLLRHHGTGSGFRTIGP